MPRAAAAIAWILLLLAAAGPASGQDPGAVPDTLINAWCPVMTDREVDETSATVMHEGKPVRLCCKKCVAKFRAEPGKYLARLPQFGGREGEDAAPPAGREPAAPPPWTRRLGRFHPMVVHFPIALLLLAAMLEIAAVLRKRPAHGPAARPLVLAGAAGAVLAAVLGSLLSEEMTLTGTSADLLDRHSLTGWWTAGLAVAAAAAGEILRKRGGRALRAAYTLLLVAGAALVGFAGHAGGLLVFGSEWFAGG